MIANGVTWLKRYSWIVEQSKFCNTANVLTKAIPKDLIQSVYLFQIQIPCLFIYHLPAGHSINIQMLHNTNTFLFV